jgi:hypothetical protein
MSVLTLLVPVVIALIAALLRAAIVGDWVLRSLVGHFAFALCVLLLPAIIHS